MIILLMIFLYLSMYIPFFFAIFTNKFSLKFNDCWSIFQFQFIINEFKNLFEFKIGSQSLHVQISIISINLLIQLN